MKRLSILIYGALSYVLFLVTFLYAIGFIGNFWVPKSLDSAPEMSLAAALLVDVVLLTLFALQHSVMARPAFKRRWTRVIPQSAERSTYTLFSSLALIVLFLYWQPLGGLIWDVDAAAVRIALHLGCAFGWSLVLLSTFQINHFDLFGLRQVWLQFVQRPYTSPPFGMPLFYRYVRHPLYVGWLFAFWCTPTMTVTHLLFAGATSLYILAAIQLEERDLVNAHPEYAEYRRSVPMLIPRRARRAKPVVY